MVDDAYTLEFIGILARCIREIPMLTEQQLEALAAALRPPIAKLLWEPEEDVSVLLSTGDDPPRMRIEVRVRGKGVSLEQEAEISEFLQTPLPGSPVY